MLATLLDFDFKNFASRESWALAHSRDHDDIRLAIQAKGGPILTAWQLNPVPWNKLDDWFLRHQTAHSDFDGALNLAGQDISSVDFDNPEDAHEWNLQHFSEHQAARAALGI